MSTAGPALSLVIPAYNEARRLPPYLAAVRAYCDRAHGDAYEVLVVDDGSTDGLAAAVERSAEGWLQLHCLRHDANRGKGAAVRTGMLAARGELLLFADADGATPIEEEARLAAAIRNGADVAVGSRLLADADHRCARPWFRRLAGRAFAAAVRLLLPLPVHDTQCGFKMFTRKAGREIFSAAVEPRFLFDLEILTLAQQFGYRIVELPINWTEVPGGQFSLLREFPRAVADLLRLRQRLKQRRRAHPCRGRHTDQGRT